MSTQEIVRTIPLFFLAITAIISLRSFRYQFPSPLKLFSIVIIFWFFVQCIAHGMALYGIRNYWVYNIANPLYFLALAWIYTLVLNGIILRKIISSFYILFILLVLINSLFFQNIQDYQTITVVTGRTFIFLLAAIYFRQSYLSSVDERISRDPFFWFSFGFLLHFGVTVPFLGMFNYLYNKYPSFTTEYYFYFANSFAILQYLFDIIGFLCRKNFQRKLF